MKVEILSRDNIRAKLQEEPNIHNAIIISEPWKQEEVADLLPLCNDVLHLSFDDIIDRHNVFAPTLTHVREALGWSKGKESILVACHAGICRSAAIAFLVMCQEHPADEAVKALIPRKHYPNELVIEHGMNILGEHIKPVIDDFYKVAVSMSALIDLDD